LQGVVIGRLASRSSKFLIMLVVRSDCKYGFSALTEITNQKTRKTSWNLWLNVGVFDNDGPFLIILKTGTWHIHRIKVLK